MKKTYIAIALASIFTVGGAYAADTVKYLNDQVDLIVGEGKDWNETVNTEYKYIVMASDGKTHTIAGGAITVTHKPAPDNSGSFQASNGSTLNISGADKLTLSLTSETVRPNLVHAFGGTINLEAVKDVVLTGEHDGSVVMAQALPGNSALMNITSTAGSVTIESADRGAVLAGLLQQELENRTTEVKISAAKNVTLRSGTNSAVQLFNRNYPEHGWQSDAGSAVMSVTAGEALTIAGVNGVYSRVTQGSSQLSSTFTAGKAINIEATQNALNMTGESTEGRNSVSFDAPEMNFTSTQAGATTIKVSEKNSTVSFGNRKTQGAVTISSNNGYAIDAGDSSTLNFTKSDVVVNGNVRSNGTISITDTAFTLTNGANFEAIDLNGSNSSIVVDELSVDSSTVFVKKNNVKDLAIVASSNLNDQYQSAEEAAAAIVAASDITDNEANGASHNFAGLSGALSDAWKSDSTGKLTSVTKNQSMDALGNLNAMTLVQWRGEMNHLSQRLGDVRDASSKVGAWARVYGYDSSYNDSVSIDYKANSIQVGGDYRIDNTWLVGGAFSYTNGEGTFSNGSSDSDGYSLAAYASGFFDCGAYVDVIGRVGRLSTDIKSMSDTSVFKGSYDNTTFGLSAEVGYHWKLNDTFYVEPQAELAYGFVKGDDFTGTNGVTISQDDFQTLVGRLGARVGATFADGAGTVYVHASANHDFLGDADFTAKHGTASRDFSYDLGTTWYSYGVGAQFNTSKNLNFYGTLERANGSEYQEDYRYSVGMSYRF
ncbi:autotransporter outer membrane beta-barrel domain-containing protein [Sutterella sp.]|uniref:autotransporter outer membrane beta-barrel domain-containing protein n=1 Tax=Sutterella sp. TaxID=1981025 RepID=UPI003FD6EC7E